MEICIETCAYQQRVREFPPEVDVEDDLRDTGNRQYSTCEMDRRAIPKKATNIETYDKEQPSDTETGKLQMHFGDQCLPLPRVLAHLSGPSWYVSNMERGYDS
jgi:hypothetical protein